jgi:hypothetical protein
MTTGEIIEGIQFQLEAHELEELLETRTNYHAEKFEQYTLHYEAIRRDKPGGYSNDVELRTSYNPAEAAYNKMMHHQSEMKKYDFMRRHVIPGAKYRITHTDLARIVV